MVLYLLATGVATTSDVASAVNSAVTAAVTNATGNQKLDISAGGTDSSVNLKTQKINGNWYRCCYNQCGWSNHHRKKCSRSVHSLISRDGTTTASWCQLKAADVATAINNANTALSQKLLMQLPRWAH